MEALSPKQILEKVNNIGIAKAEKKSYKTLLLGILAGIFVSFGAVFYFTVNSGLETIPFGLKKLIGGIVFGLGIVLVLIAGAELFTGNTLICVSCLNKKIKISQLLKNWGLVYAGNFIGSIFIAGLLVAAGWHLYAGGEVGMIALKVAYVKLSHTWTEAFVLGILANMLVCLAVWLAYSGKSNTDRIMGALFPVAAFVSAGFEHCIANMFFIPFAIFIKGNPAFVEFTHGADINWVNFLTSNLIPVTLGNIVGGAVFVGVIYWIIYKD